MESQIDCNVMACEVMMLSNEVWKRQLMVEEGNARRKLFVQAQVEVCLALLEFCRNEEQWQDDLAESVRDAVDEQYALYSEARFNNNHDVAIITLARIRVLSTLLRRIADPSRPLLLRDVDPATFLIRPW